MRALILSHGHGSRLASETGGLPKCLTKVGGRSLLDRAAGELQQAGVSHIDVSIGPHHDAEEVCRHIVNLSVHVRTQHPRGFAHDLATMTQEQSVVLDGDLLLPSSEIARFVTLAVKTDADLVIGVCSDETPDERSTWISTSGNSVTNAVRSSSTEGGLALVGIYLWEPSALAALSAHAGPLQRFPPILARIAESHSVRAVVVKRPVNINTPEDLRRAETMIDQSAE
ncbi:MAG: NTP transferase domain-containing protein [Sulfitobacter sp.]|nr:NTP transferase domain-containing protein [Sulfitobacter sp.]